MMEETISSHTITVIPGELSYYKPFTRSNGTILARLYERLTKASRRRYEQASAHGEFGPFTEPEIAYRQGVYDALKALQNELQS